MLMPFLRMLEPFQGERYNCFCGYYFQGGLFHKILFNMAQRGNMFGELTQNITLNG